MPGTNMHTTALLNILREFTRGEDRDSFIQKVLKVLKTFKVKSLKRPKFDVPAKKTAYTLFCKDMQETELKSATVSQASAIISREWKKVKASDEKMQKYRNLYEVKKQQYEEPLQRYQEDHTDEMEIISLHKRCYKTGTKTAAKAAATKVAKTAAKTNAKTPRSGYHLFSR